MIQTSLYRTDLFWTTPTLRLGDSVTKSLKPGTCGRNSRSGPNLVFGTCIPQVVRNNSIRVRSHSWWLDIQGVRFSHTHKKVELFKKTSWRRFYQETLPLRCLETIETRRANRTSYLSSPENFYQKVLQFHRTRTPVS